jgi:NAD(P)-dependent dehydrogenase (short-subunit alcohol dehydrogenase family)
VTRPAVLVTGGAKRIGAVIVRAFAEAGWHVVIHYGRSAREAEALAAELPSADALHCDLVDGNVAAEFAAMLAVRLPDWRALVNCASVFELDDATSLDMDKFRRALRVNAASPAKLAQVFLARARSAAGKRVIQFTDQKLGNPNPDFFSYTMSKHAAAAIVPMLAAAIDNGALGGPEDRVYGLAPGAILPSHDQTAEETEVSHRLNLLRRTTGADEIAAACLWLAEGRLANGETLYVDSGQHLLSQARDVIYLAREAME